MKYILMTLVIIIIIVCLLFPTHFEMYNEYFASACANDCVKTHSQSGNNYSWLNVLGHGKVKEVKFEEPVDSENWKVYTDDWWKIHCKAIDHDPDNLVEAHVMAFINPNQRFAKLEFTFEDGTKMEPTRQFYDLEADYFRKNGYCGH